MGNFVETTNLNEDLFRLGLSISSPGEEKRKKEIENFRINSAAEVIKVLRTENIGFIADTGTGKTIIAFIVSLVDILLSNKNYRVLFLVPRRGLAHQHKKLFYKVYKNETIQTEVFIGGVKRREWGNKEISIIFATPQMFMNDVDRGLASVEYFDLIVVDEFHRASGKYKYVDITKLAEKFNKKILGLSASPGGTKEKIDSLKKNSSIPKFIRAKVETPRKLEDTIFAGLDETLIDIEQSFFKLFSAVEKKLEENGIILKKEKKELSQYLLGDMLSILEKVQQYKPITEKELKMIEESINAMSKFGRGKWDALIWYTVYRKLKHAYAICLTESYFTFLTYVEKLKKDKTKASKRIIASSTFQKIISSAEKHRDEHPKILALIKNARHLYRLKMKTIIFIGERITGEYIKGIMNKKIEISEVVFGGQKNTKKQFEAIEKLKNGELMFLISTSVIEEGLNVPEVNAVVHYSMPINEISRIQRSGRTARIDTGNVVFIVLNHPIDKALYWMTFRGEKNMVNFLEKIENPELEKHNIPIKNKKKTKRYKETLDLFDSL